MENIEIKVDEIKEITSSDSKLRLSFNIEDVDKFFDNLLAQLDQDIIINAIIERYGNAEIIAYIGKEEAAELVLDEAKKIIEDQAEYEDYKNGWNV